MHTSSLILATLLSTASGWPTGHDDKRSVQPVRDYLTATTIHDEIQVNAVKDAIKDAIMSGSLSTSVSSEDGWLAENIAQDLLKAIEDDTLLIHVVSSDDGDSLNTAKRSLRLEEGAVKTNYSTDDSLHGIIAPRKGVSGGGSGGKGIGGSSGSAGIQGALDQEMGTFFEVKCQNVATDGNTFFTGFDSNNKPFTGQLLCTYPAAKRPKERNTHWFYGKSGGEKFGIVLGMMIPSGGGLGVGAYYLDRYRKRLKEAREQSRGTDCELSQIDRATEGEQSQTSKSGHKISRFFGRG